MYKIRKAPAPRVNAYVFMQQIPWSTWQKGDCIEIPRADLTLHDIEAVRSTLYKTARRHMYHVSTQITDNRTILVWRKD